MGYCFMDEYCRACPYYSDFDTYEKLHASTNPTFTESSTTGFYGHTKQNVRDTYADVLATFAKTFVNDQLSLNANIGASISDLNDDAMYIKGDRKSTRLNSSHANISYAVFCLKKKKKSSA